MRLRPMKDCEDMAAALGLKLYEGENSMNGSAYIAVINKHGHAMTANSSWADWMMRPASQVAE